MFAMLRELAQAALDLITPPLAETTLAEGHGVVGQDEESSPSPRTVTLANGEVWEIEPSVEDGTLWEQ